MASGVKGIAITANDNVALFINPFFTLPFNVPSSSVIWLFQRKRAIQIPYLAQLGTSARSIANPLIPNTSSAVMRHSFLPFGFHQLHGIIQEKIYQDRIDLGLGVITLNLTPDELDAPDAASYIPTCSTNGPVGGYRKTRLTSKLHFILASTLKGFFSRYQGLQGRAISHTAERG